MASEQVLERPKTSRGRRAIPPAGYEPYERPCTSRGHHELADSTEDSASTTPPLQRPTTSRGRYPDDSSPHSDECVSERPKTSHGRGHQPPHQDISVDDYAVASSDKEVNILVLDKSGIAQKDHHRTASRHKRSKPRSRTESEQSEISDWEVRNSQQERRSSLGAMQTSHLNRNQVYHQPGEYADIATRLSPHPPPSAQRSSRRRSTPHLHHADGLHGEFSRPPTSEFDSRPPSSASLNKFSVLPRIGSSTPRYGVTMPSERESPPRESSLPTDTSLRRKQGRSKAEMAKTSNDSKQKTVSPQHQQPVIIPTSIPPPTRKNTENSHHSDGSSSTVTDKDNPGVASGLHSSGETPERHKPEPTPVIKPQHSETENVDEKNRSNNGCVSPEYKPLQRKVNIPHPPTDSEPRLLLAIKLPTGPRLMRNFRLTETIQTVINFAEVEANLDFAGYELVCSVSRKVWSRMTESLKDAGLEDKTVVYLQLPEK